MSDVDVSKIKYNVRLITENGEQYLINTALTFLQWEEQKNELAQKATIKVVNTKIGATTLFKLVKMNCLIRISANWGEVNKRVFEGFISELERVNGKKRELIISICDPLIRLQLSEDFKYYSAGLKTEAIVESICKDWGIALDYTWEQSIIHEKQAFRGDTISNMLIKILEEVRQKTGKKYIAYYRNGKFVVCGYGNNKTIYKFDSNNTISTSRKLSVNSLVTRVKVIGKENKDERAPIEAIVDGDTRFGVFQKIVVRDSDKSLAAAKDEATALIKEKGKPEEIIKISLPDMPVIRKGDTIECAVDNLIGFFSVEGISHNASERQMELTLSTEKKGLKLWQMKA
ncbi:MAG: hypothetical protein FWH05_08755 [Oscillospiraceae bacterium]|nr:hypothetical protein [Oscillospiraceae bacterium]